MAARQKDFEVLQYIQEWPSGFPLFRNLNFWFC